MSGDFTQVCVPSGGGGSGINLEALPPLPDPEVLDAQVQSMIVAGVGFHNGVQDAARNWAGLRAFYRTPEAEQVLGAFTPALAKAARVKDLTGAAARALYAYADRARDFKRRITGLRAEVQALDAVILANDDWHTKAQIVDTHERLMSAASGLAQQILDSDTQCANELSALTHGHRYTPVEVPRRTVFASTDQVANGFSWLQHQLGTDAPVPDLPWGPAVSIRHEGRLSAMQGFGTAAVGAVQGLYTLFGTKDKTQQAQAWQGVGALGAAVFRSKAVIDRGFTDMDDGDIEALLTAAAAIKETVHADEWATDYWRAGGQTTFDLATAATGGAGGGLTLEARITALAARLRGLPTKAAAVAELGGEAASASVKAGSGTAGLEAATARIESHLAAVGKTVDDYEIPRATSEAPGLPEEPTPADGQTAKWSKEVSTPDLNVQPAQSKGIWTDDINRTKTTPPPEPGPRTSGIDEARLRQRLNPANPEPAASSSHAAPEAPEHSPGPGTHVGPSATLEHGADELLQTEDRSVDVNASGRPTSDPAHVEGPVQATEVYGEPRAVHGEHPPYPELTDKNREVMALRTDFEARWGRDDNGYGRPFTKHEYEIRYSGPEKNGQPRHVYPPFDGAILETLQKFHDLSAFVQKFGSQMDRVGPQSGRFIGVIENGVPATFEERSLPVAQLGDKYYQYKLVDAWPPDAKGWSIEVARIAPAFGRKGGGLQMVIKDANGLNVSVERLIQVGILEK